MSGDLVAELHRPHRLRAPKLRSAIPVEQLGRVAPRNGVELQAVIPTHTAGRTLGL